MGEACWRWININMDINTLLTRRLEVMRAWYDQQASLGTRQSLQDWLGRILQNCCENVYLLPQIVYDFIFITLYFSVNSLYLLCHLLNFCWVPESRNFIAGEEKVKMWECSFLQEHFANWEPKNSLVFGFSYTLYKYTFWLLMGDWWPNKDIHAEDMA